MKNQNITRARIKSFNLHANKETREKRDTASRYNTRIAQLMSSMYCRFFPSAWYDGRTIVSHGGCANEVFEYYSTEWDMINKIIFRALFMKRVKRVKY